MTDKIAQARAVATEQTRAEVARRGILAAATAIVTAAQTPGDE